MTREDIIKPENLVYKRTPVLTDATMHYCPGCGHGVVHRIIAEVIEEMGIQDNVIGISPVGWAVLKWTCTKCARCGRPLPTRTVIWHS